MSAVDSLLRPKSVAIVGASNSIDKIGGRPLHYLLKHGFAGPVYPVNQRGEPVQGLASYRSLEDLPQAPDCVVLSVPADAALEQVRACVRIGAGSGVLFSSGFAELGAEGRDAQRRVADAAREGGLRLLGPNTIGSANFACGAVLSFASIYQDFAPQDGPVAIVSQSGAVGASVYALLRENAIGVRYVCATGNQADLDAVDLLAAVLRDGEVRIVLLYLEEVRNPAALRAALAVAHARRVPVVVLAAGRSAGGARMAEFHTGSAGLRDGALAQVLAETGCRLVANLPELAASVPLHLLDAARPASPLRIGVMSNSGASCVLTADACDTLGIALADFSAGTRAQLDDFLPAFSRSRNPVDLTAMLLADGALFGRCVDVVLADAGCDALALSLLAVAGAAYDVPRFAASAGDAMRLHRKPVAFSSPDARVRAAFAAQGVAVFASEGQAVEALKQHSSESF
jgi:acyl-CoA synthetase (NDP forming)